MKLTRQQTFILSGLAFLACLVWFVGVTVSLAVEPAQPEATRITEQTAAPTPSPSSSPTPTEVPPTPTAQPTATATATLTPEPPVLFTASPSAPSPTPCDASCYGGVLGVIDYATPTSPPAAAGGGRLGYAMQIHGCGSAPPAPAVKLVALAEFNWVKQQVRWDEVEGVRGVYAWRCVDEVVNQAGRRGLRVLLSVNTVPAWAKTGAGAPDSQLFAEFVAEVARRYTGRVAAIEVFNEPNLAIEWGARLDPDGYAQLLVAAARRIKAVDPSILVISAGLAPTRWNDWGAALDDLKYMQRIGPTLAQYADCIGVHYNDGVSSPLDPGSPFEQLVTDYLRLTGHAKPVCLTEFGIAAPVGETPPPRGFEWAGRTTERQVAQWLIDGFRWAQQHPGAVRLIVVWNLDYYSGADDPNSLFALNGPQGLRPAYYALQRMTKP